jgi:hypothetical protein
MHGRAYDDYRVGIEETIKKPQRPFGYVNFKEKRVGYSSIMHFKGSLASGPDNICNLFAYFIQRTYADDAWVPSDPESDLLVLFSSLWMRYRVCCWSWMSAKM